MRTLLLAVAVALLFAGSARAAENYCTYGHGTALLFVDRTTSFDATDRGVFLDAAGDVIDQLGPGDRLVVVTMTGAFTDSRKLFDQCKPGCPDEGFFAGLLSTCAPTLARARLQSFTASLAATLAELLRKPEDTPASDLFRTIAEITRAYATPADASRPIRSVIVFSDLLENSQLLPERELRVLPVARIEKRLDDAGLLPKVGGANVRVFGFGRDDSPGRPPLPQDQRKRIGRVWEDWFRAGGAADVSIGYR